MSTSQDLDQKQRLRMTAVYYVASLAQGLGKTKLQKLIYFAQEAFCLPLGYEFRMYHYGPYSFDLDDDLSRMNMIGLVDVTPDPTGYGFRISPLGDNALEVPLADLSPDEREPLDRVIKSFGDFDAQELELRATIHFVSALTESSDPEEIAMLVKRLKPKFSGAKVKGAWQELHQQGCSRQAISLHEG